MKKILFSILFLVSVFIPFSVISAEEDTSEVSLVDESVKTQIDENTTQVSNKYFDLVLTQLPQSFWDKSIPYKIEIVPHLDSDQVQILWNTPASVNITTHHKEFVSMTTGQTYEYRANIKPTKEGTYSVSVNVIAWQYDTNYTNTVSDDIEINSDLISVPISPEYQIGVIVKILFFVAIAGLAIWGGVILTKRGLKKAKVWLTPPY